MNANTNITRIKAVNNALNNLDIKVVFVGRATVSLYVDREVFEVRPTDDVDVLVEIITYQEGSALEERLREIGFSNKARSF